MRNEKLVILGLSRCLQLALLHRSIASKYVRTQSSVMLDSTSSREQKAVVTLYSNAHTGHNRGGGKQLYIHFDSHPNSQQVRYGSGALRMKNRLTHKLVNLEPLRVSIAKYVEGKIKPYITQTLLKTLDVQDAGSTQCLVMCETLTSTQKELFCTS